MPVPSPCDILIARGDELERQLAAAWAERDPGVLGNGCMVLGTVDRADLRRVMGEYVMVDELIDMLHPPAGLLDIRMDPGGWRLPSGR